MIAQKLFRQPLARQFVLGRQMLRIREQLGAAVFDARGVLPVDLSRGS